MKTHEPAQQIPIHRPRKGPWLQLFTARGFEWNSATLPIGGLHRGLEGLRILQLSDLHIRARWDRAHDELIRRTRDNPPDLILYCGDVLEHKFDQHAAIATMQKLLGALPSRLGGFAILGNHDGDLITPHFGLCGVTMLNDQLARVEHSGADIEIIGFRGISRRDLHDVVIAGMPPRKPGALRLVMTHFPDSVTRLASLGADVIFTGHTHGGQVCLPGGWPPIRHDSLPRRMCQGIHRVGGSWLVVSRGFGFATWPVRLFCAAEVLEITLAPAEGQAGAR
ncbi:MAG: metallophosphoesterase [Tepidisphaeraceae bacterium]